MGELLKYYEMDINPSSKKWKGCININTDLFDKLGHEVNNIDLSEKQSRIRKKLFYKILTDGAITPVTSIGSRFLAFDCQLSGIKKLKCPEIQYLSISNDEKKHEYLLMHIFTHIDCVDWERSEIDRWPIGYVHNEWDNKRGRWFIDPVLIKDKIPDNLDAFRLLEWGGAFNIVITNRYKNKILSLDFDHSFLDFRELKVL
jgi:hypothetical protein